MSTNLTWAKATDGVTGAVLTSAHTQVMDVVREGLRYAAKRGVHPSLIVEDESGEKYYYEYTDRTWRRVSDCGKDVPPPAYRLDGGGSMTRVTA